MSRLRVGLDCDGVVCNFEQYIIDQINVRLGTEFKPEDHHSWSLTDSFGETAGKLFHDLMDEEVTWFAPHPYPGAVDLANRMAAVSDIYMITHLPKQFLEVRRNWLTLNGFPKMEVICAGEKWREVQRLALDTLIDDRYENCIEVVNRCYTPAYMVERPWNNGKPSHPLLTRGPLERAVERIEVFARKVAPGELVS